MAKGYGRWLAWLDSRVLLDAQVAPGDRITPDRVKAYVGHLEAENASGTVIARIIELKVMAAIMDPGTRLVLDLSIRIFNAGSAQAGPAEAASSRPHRKAAEISGSDLMAKADRRDDDATQVQDLP